MSVQNWMKPGYGPRRSCRILSVDPANRIVHATLKDATVVQVAIFDTPGFFIWPKPNEYWTIHQYNGIWMLNHRLGNQDDQQIDGLKAGEGKIDADIIKTSSGYQLAAMPIIKSNTKSITASLNLNEYYSHYDGEILNSIELPYAGTYLANYKVLVEAIDPNATGDTVVFTTSLCIGSSTPVATSSNIPINGSEIGGLTAAGQTVGGMNHEFQFTTSDQTVGNRTLKQLFSLKAGVGSPLQPIKIIYQQLSITPVSTSPW